MISGERKKFGLTARRSIKTSDLNPRLANTGQIVLPDGSTKPFMFTFSDSFVEFVGTMLPMGVSPYNPACIFVTQEAQDWIVWAAYVEDGKHQTALWRASDKPNWIPEVNHGTQDRRTPSCRPSPRSNARA